jgi:hypothetical protein
MPRHWHRKSQKYVPEIEILLRNANPTRSEIEGELDRKKREARQRERDIARDELMRMYRDWNSGTSSILDFRVRLFCERLIAENEGRIPPPLNTGRPPDKHRRLLIAVHVKEAIEASGGKRGSVKAALSEVARRDGVSYDQVRDIHYDPDPDWRGIVAVELSRRKAERVGAKQAGVEETS